MSHLTLEYPVAILPGLPTQDGQRFEGYVRDGKLHLTVHETPVPALPDALNNGEESAVAKFVKKWSGRGKFGQFTEKELADDPRLAYLVEKHLK
jgi:hypothetical protein